MSDHYPPMKRSSDKSLYVPFEIIHEILLRLSIKCLVNCTAVCKAWRSLIRNRDFIHAHSIQSQQRSSNTLFLVQEVFFRSQMKACEFFSLCWDDPIYGQYTALGESPFPGISEAKFRQSSVVGTCNGLVCLTEVLMVEYFSVMLWNPSIHRFLILPNSTIPNNFTRANGRVHYGFGFDCQKIDYKVVRILIVDHPYQLTSNVKVDVYSTTKGLWNTLDVAIPQLDGLETYFGIFVNGFLHWVAYNVLYEGRNVESFILTFDVGNELFEVLPVPKMKGVLPLHKTEDAFVFGESLALIQRDTDRFFVWTMQEYGVPESWKLLFSIGPITPVHFDQNILATWMRANMLMVRYEDDESELISINLDTKQCFYTSLHHNYSFSSPYVETLALLDNVSAVSYQANI